MWKDGLNKRHVPSINNLKAGLFIIKNHFPYRENEWVFMSETWLLHSTEM